jgi:glycosyltransferase involved in cell wall biosynthesis
MLKRVDLFMPPSVSQYGVLQHFTKMLAEAFIRKGVHCRILEAQRHNPKPFLTQLFSDPPDCTLSFNGLLPDEEGRFFCDLIQIPHVACLVDSPNRYFPLVKSPFTIITCVDRFSCDFFQGMGCQHVLFLPHGVERQLNGDNPESNRNIDILMLASCIDYEDLQSAWKDKYPANLRKVMEETCEIALSDEGVSYVQAFVNCLNKHLSGPSGIDPKTINFAEVLDEIELTIRGKERVQLLRSIKDAPIQLYGSQDTKNGWEYYLKDQSNVSVHSSVPYDRALELMKNSKIVLNSCAWIKNGTHERTLSALACGALVLTNENLYMKEYFTDERNILFYRSTGLDAVNAKINKFLADPALLHKVAKQGRDVVMHNHTWDHRAAILIRELGPILSKLKNTPPASV